MSRQRTNKTAVKRVRSTNPKGNRKAKLLYTKARAHHLRTKLSSRSKRRKLSRSVVTPTNDSNIRKLTVNI